tara:strand:+ start:256 stop:1359 length:1104 start_codon:yes stop_codon:yes gene_type:complete
MTLNYKNKKINIALVGCGRISRNHIIAIYKHFDKAKLVAICDPNFDNLNSTLRLIEEQAQENKIDFTPPASFENLEQMISTNSSYEHERKIDLMVIATPSGLHAKQTIASAKAGFHVCTEKPMATNLEDGILMVNECKKAKVNLFVVKQNRFNSTLKLIKKQIDSGRFGKIYLATANVFWQRPQSYYDQAKWRGTIELDGGALMNQASHYVDLMEWLIGPLECVSASIATIGRKIEVEDTAALQFRYKSGALGTMAVSMLTYPKNLEGSITILGENGTVKIGGKAVNKIEYWEFADNHSDDKEINNYSYETSSIYGFGHFLYYQNMIDSLKGLDTPACNGDEGLKSLEIIVGSYLSAKNSETVYFPL